MGIDSQWFLCRYHKLKILHLACNQIRSVHSGYVMVERKTQHHTINVLVLNRPLTSPHPFPSPILLLFLLFLLLLLLILSLPLSFSFSLLHSLSPLPPLSSSSSHLLRFFSQLRELEYVNLSGNTLSSLPPIPSCPKLYCLLLHSNHLSSLPMTPVLKHLHTMDLGCNNFETIPEVSTAAID